MVRFNIFKLRFIPECIDSYVLEPLSKNSRLRKDDVHLQKKMFLK